MPEVDGYTHLHQRQQCRMWTDIHTFTRGSNVGCGRINTPSPEAAMRRWTDKHTFTGGSNAGGGPINTPSPEAAMPDVDG